MATVLIQQARLTDAADAWRLGIPDRAFHTEPERTDPTMVRQLPASAPTYFPRPVMNGGFKIAVERIMRLGGRMDRPRGPGIYHDRVKAPPRSPAAGPGVRSKSVRQIPAGLTPTEPWWTSTMQGSDGYLAP